MMDVRGLLKAACLLYILRGVILLDLQGPLFLSEPLHRIEFSNNSGTHIECTGHGSPPPDVEWSVATTNHELVYASPNGSLIFYPFTADKFRHEIHSTVYRCKLKNLVGTILSREVHVKGGKFFFSCTNHITMPHNQLHLRGVEFARKGRRDSNFLLTR
ncbi:cell adhesion molecule Dscam2-like [Culex pipiens pallens]|uniref:cell adhesion molecule Dscam2-like n=1 Tax=Culex pipiens pallens TaxID=42434 RepID=UPI001954782F|nr:cell adhesion molecule Dscam2-like [Culex pipiens pallens]